MTFSLVLLTGCSGDQRGESDAVTKAEYQAAAQAAAECIRNKGFDTSDPEEQAAGNYAISLHTDAGDDQQAAAAERAWEQCWNKHALPIEKRYIRSRALTGEEWEADYRELLVCLEDAGVTGLKVGDPEEVVGLAITEAGDDRDAILCLQAHLNTLFPEEGR